MTAHGLARPCLPLVSAADPARGAGKDAKQADSWLSPDVSLVATTARDVWSSRGCLGGTRVDAGADSFNGSVQSREVARIEFGVILTIVVDGLGFSAGRLRWASRPWWG